MCHIAAFSRQNDSFFSPKKSTQKQKCLYTYYLGEERYQFRCESNISNLIHKFIHLRLYNYLFLMKLLNLKFYIDYCFISYKRIFLSLNLVLTLENHQSQQNDKISMVFIVLNLVSDIQLINLIVTKSLRQKILL